MAPLFLLLLLHPTGAQSGDVEVTATLVQPVPHLDEEPEHIGDDAVSNNVTDEYEYGMEDAVYVAVNVTDGTEDDVSNNVTDEYEYDVEDAVVESVYRIDKVTAARESDLRVKLEWTSIDNVDQYIVYRETGVGDEEEEDMISEELEANVREVGRTSDPQMTVDQAPCQRSRYGVSIVINGDYGGHIEWSNVVKTDLNQQKPFSPTNLGMWV